VIVSLLSLFHPQQAGVISFDAGLLRCKNKFIQRFHLTYIILYKVWNFNMKEFDYTNPPITYFGRKNKIGKQVWDLFGNDCKVYVEPFAGSLGVYLKRPEHYKDIIARLGDFDGLVVNFWRAVVAQPNEIAEWCTRPVNECDLSACHIKCVENKARLVPKLSANPEYYDLKLACYWAYGINCWIGGNWCNTKGPWIRDDATDMMINKHNGKIYGTDDVLNDLTNDEEGVRAKKPVDGFKSLLSQADEGGVWAQKPVDAFKYLLSQADGEPNAYDSKLNRNIKWLNHLSSSLMRATIVCQGWERLLTKSYTTEGAKLTAIFLDPPYDEQQQSQSGNYYGENNSRCISTDVREWCKSNSSNKLLKIVLCGYNDEHDELLNYGFEKIGWNAKNGAGYRKADTTIKTEFLWHNTGASK
jgi:site-specific DNA-adenine methylase